MRPSACPDAKSLERFQLGLLSEPEADSLEQHLQRCPACVARLDTGAAADPLLAALRPVGPGSSDTPASVDPSLLLRLKDLFPAVARSAGDTPQGLDLETTDAPRSSLPAPTILGRYRIRREVGAGGMGTVYEAHDPDLDRTVAVKVPHFAGSAARQARARERFLREALTAARVRHPHVCPIYDVGQHEGIPYVVMAFVEGRSLAEHLTRHGRFEDARQAVTLVRQVALALQAIHDHGIVHRDLKPGNILLQIADCRFKIADCKSAILNLQSAIPMLTDFGLARRTDAAEPLTAEGTVLGTPAYMAPEQVEPALGPVGPASDVYSLGVVLYEMLTGRTPFTGMTTAVLRQVADGTPPAPSALRSELSPTLEAILSKALARWPEERYASAADFGLALAGWLDGVAPTGSVPRARGRPAGRGRGSRLSRSVAVAVLLLLTGGLVGAAYFALRPGREDSVSPVTASPGAGPALGGGPALDGGPALGVGPALGGGLPTPPTPPAFKGWLYVQVWDPVNPRRNGLRLTESGALPLRADDRVRIDAGLNRPAYLYVLLIDTGGKATPLYPWKHFRWADRPATETARDKLSLPEEPGPDGKPGGWRVAKGPPGMETLILLARATPLPGDVDVPTLLDAIPVQKEQSLRAAVWFENGAVVRDEAERGFVDFDPQRIDDPVLQTQDLLKRRLGPYVQYSRAVSYANQGK